MMVTLMDRDGWYRKSYKQAERNPVKAKMTEVRVRRSNLLVSITTSTHTPTCSTFHGPSFHLFGPLSDGEPTVVLLPNFATVVGQFARLIEDDELVVFLLNIADHCGHFHAHSACYHA